MCVCVFVCMCVSGIYTLCVARTCVWFMYYILWIAQATSGHNSNILDRLIQTGMMMIMMRMMMSPVATFQNSLMLC